MIADLTIRTYGAPDAQPVIVLHGGPAAPGPMAPIARELADEHFVIEPFQRGSGEVPLTVRTHLDDLHAIIEAMTSTPPVLVGSSWGAMLALAFAADRPDASRSVAAIGCGTFDVESRARMVERIAERSSAEVLEARRRADAIEDPDDRLAALGAAIFPIYATDPITDDLEEERCDARAHRETWSDMIRRQEEGEYPAAFGAITAPVILLHGDDDPHPGAMIRDSLLPHIPHLEYHAWARCGHYPWIERSARSSFFDSLREFIRRT
ncbi:MAG: alpha/beta hydrolase [Planctomycetes bacterium]|nr:alpha/beta hydrolase [Planctomycetota bacterium]